MILHWLVAVLIITNVALALTVDWFPGGMVRPIIDLHKSIGITVLGLALLRILWRLSHRPPPLPAHHPKRERLAAHTVHILLYGLILALPISGWVHDSAFKLAAAHPLRLFWLVPFPRIGPIAVLDPVTKEHVHSVWYAIHTWLAYSLYVLVALHVLGALKHQFVDRDGELRRMFS